MSLRIRVIPLFLVRQGPAALGRTFQVGNCNTTISNGLALVELKNKGLLPTAPPPRVSLSTRALAAVLPSGFPASVAPSYTAYSLWSSMATVFASTAGVLATQSLLFALGVGAGVAVPASAAWTWVCKDGLGQLGGVIYAAALGDRFDTDPKRWRFASAVAGDAAGALEVALALAPAALPFLPIAALANVGRNVAWLSASATKAGLHQALATHGNLADVTAKAGSQITAAATLGTAAGVALSPFLGGDPFALAALFGSLSFAHVTCVTLSLRAVALPTLSDVRLRLACGEMAQLPAAAACKHVYLTPSAVRALERFLPGQRGADALKITAPAAARISVEIAPHLETVLDFSTFAAACGFLDNLEDSSISSNTATATATTMARYVIVLNAPIHASDGGPSYITTQVLFASDATWGDTLCGHLHALRAAAVLQGVARGEGVRRKGECDYCNNDTRVSFNHNKNNRDNEGGGGTCLSCRARIVLEAKEWTQRVSSSHLIGLEKSGWWVGTPLLERGSETATRRIEIISKQANTK